MIALLAFVAQVHAKDLLANHQVHSQGSSDKLVDKLVEKLSNRLLQASPLDDTGLDDTVIAKPGALAAGTRPIVSGPWSFPSVSQSSLRNSPVVAQAKKGFHPEPRAVLFEDTTMDAAEREKGNGKFVVISAMPENRMKDKDGNDMIGNWEGEEYPKFEIDVSSASHAFFQPGGQRKIDSESAEAKFNKKFGDLGDIGGGNSQPKGTEAPPES